MTYSILKGKVQLTALILMIGLGLVINVARADNYAVSGDVKLGGGELLKVGSGAGEWNYTGLVFDDSGVFFNPIDVNGTAFTINSGVDGRTAVVGGGIAGMSFAIYAAACGHKIELFEKDSRLGGRLLCTSRPASRYDSFNYRHWLIVQLSRSENIQINLNTLADARLLSSGRYDAVVYANGTLKCEAPGISGWGDIPYVLASEVMARPEALPPLEGKRVAVREATHTSARCGSSPKWVQVGSACLTRMPLRQTTLLHP